jgi:hypothetical protein
MKKIRIAAIGRTRACQRGTRRDFLEEERDAGDNPA